MEFLSRRAPPGPDRGGARDFRAGTTPGSSTTLIDDTLLRAVTPLRRFTEPDKAVTRPHEFLSRTRFSTRQ